MLNDMGHEGRDPIDELRAYARLLYVDADSAFVPIDTLSPVPGRLPPRAAFATSAPILIALTAALAVLLIGGGAGVTLAADSSIPGERLYGIDLLIEDISDAIGLTTDHAVERFQEADTLAERGEVAAALETARVGARARSGDGWSEDMLAALTDLEELMGTDTDSALSSFRQLLAAATTIDDAPDEAAATIAGIAGAIPAGTGSDGTPGQGPGSTPPGQDPDFTPPGQDPGSPPPGQDPDFTPPGQDPDFTPPGQDPDSTPPGQDPDFTPPGGQDPVTPGQGQGDDGNPGSGGGGNDGG